LVAVASVAIVIAVVALIVALAHTGSTKSAPPRSAGIPVLMPDVVGKQATQGVQDLTAQGLVVRVTRAKSANVPLDVIVSQIPRAGASLPHQSTVALVVSAGSA
jgi:beta-lactam-binding protein with PASTA domain